MFSNAKISAVAGFASTVGEGSGDGLTVYTQGVTPGRYVVGGRVPSRLFPIGTARPVIKAAIVAMLEGSPNAETLGVWEDDGTVYVDLGDTWETLEHALYAATHRSELAIYDRQDEECIRVNPA